MIIGAVSHESTLSDIVVVVAVEHGMEVFGIVTVEARPHGVSAREAVPLVEPFPPFVQVRDRPQVREDVRACLRGDV